MKTGKSLIDLATEIERQKNAARDGARGMGVQSGTNREGTMFRITKPQRREVSDASVRSWYAVARVRGELDDDNAPAETTEQMAAALERAGIIELDRSAGNAAEQQAVRQ